MATLRCTTLRPACSRRRGSSSECDSSVEVVAVSWAAKIREDQSSFERGSDEDKIKRR